MSDTKIIWTPEMLERFRRAYNEAANLLGSNEVFVFEGHEFVVSHAKYLIDFLDSEFAKD